SSDPNILVQLSFIGVLFNAITYSCIFLTTILLPFVGMRLLLSGATIMISVGFVLSGQATHVWHLYLSFSLCIGIGASIIYGAIIHVIPQWFVKNRSTVFGLHASAISLPGLFIPFLITYTVNILGITWMYRILALLFFVTNTTAVLLIKERPATLAQSNKKQGLNLHTGILKNKSLLLWTLIGPVTGWGFYIVFAFLPTYATHIGLSGYIGSATVTLFSSGGLIGRITIGFVADRLGNLNTYILVTSITAVLIFVNWMLAFSMPALYTFAFLTGFFCGAPFVLGSPITLAIVGMENYAAATSFRMLAYVFIIIGPVVATALEGISQTPFLALKVFSGMAYILSIVIALIVRLRTSQLLVKKV
ncbi:major facilitator superfamily domain-containing protein, partial [Zychaea mexicana]|uniref:major facilitator superfamily domain-containing protein n=1 Tax=Zychaea mexicana TaxID=64656 RepID=UPI0022FE20D2